MKIKNYEQKKTTHVRVDEETKELLEERAMSHGVSIAIYIRNMVEEWDEYAEDRVANYRL